MDKKNKAHIYSVLQPDTSRAVKFDNAEKYPEAKGTLYKKRIINFGEYADQWFPDYFLHLDADGWGKEVLENFAAGTTGRVYVPSSHTDDPDKNRGEVIDMFLSADGKGIDAVIDIRDPETVEKIDSDLIWDCSIGFSMNWISKDGEEKGAAIYHVALVNNPYIEDMTPFEAFAQITKDCRAELASSFDANAIMLSRSGIKKEFNNNKENEMEPKTIKNDKEYPVEVTYVDADEAEQTVTIEAGAELEIPESQVEAVEKTIAEAEAPEVEETEEEKEAREKKEKEEADAEAAKSEAEKEKDAELAKVKAENAEFRKKQIDAEYDALLKEGKIVPAQEAAYKALASSESAIKFSTGKNKTEDKPASVLLAEMFAAAPKVVKFSEDGGQGGDGTGEGETAYDKLDEEAKAGLKATGVSKERYNEQVEKHPEMYPQVTNKKDEE